MYAIVDLETTGGYASRHRIVEVAIVLHDGQQETDRYETLVNPGRTIPLHIQALTGITNEMVAKAPTFEEIAEIVEDMTRDRIFVAHNVHFDYSFLKQEFAAIHQPFQRKRLCTVRLSRKLLPQQKSYRLGALCTHLDIAYEERHRALSDALAATHLLEQLQEKDVTGLLQAALKRNSRDAVLPTHLPREQFERLPEKTGVYYFRNQKGKVVYVGKARNLKKRVAGHFSTDKSSWQKQNFMRVIHEIDFEVTGNELTALLLEAHQIKKLWPVFNKAQKLSSRWLGIVAYEDGNGYLRLGIHRMKRPGGALYHCHSMNKARHFLWQKVAEHELCARMAGLQLSEGACLDHEDGSCKGACIGQEAPNEYNPRAQAAIQGMKSELETFAIIGQGREAEERSVVLVENGQYLGFGYHTGKRVPKKLSSLKELITSRYDSQDSRNIIEAHLRKAHSDRIIIPN